MKLRFIAPAVLSATLVSLPAFAEMQLSLYGGWNGGTDSHITAHKGAVADGRDVSWDQGSSLTWPPYMGARATYWLSPQSPWGVGVEYTHTKMKADINGSDPVYSHLSLDSDDLYMVNAMYRYQRPNYPWVWYAGAGIGFDMTDVDVQFKAIPGKSGDGYQFGGVAAQVLGGLEYQWSRHWSAFGEAKFSYSHIGNDLKGAPGAGVDSYLYSPAAAVGVAYRF